MPLVLGSVPLASPPSTIPPSPPYITMAYFIYLVNEMPDLAFLYLSMFCLVWGTFAMYTIAWVNKERSTLGRGKPEKEPLWLIISSSSTAILSTACFLWRVAGAGDSGYIITTYMPGAEWCAAFAVACTAQCVISVCLARAWQKTWFTDTPMARAIGTLPVIWGTLQLAASALTLCRAIPSHVASWWIPLLLGGSALQEVLIAASCLLLAYTAVIEESRRALFWFFGFISVGCMGGISLSVVMIICRVKSASHAWDVLSMVSPLYRVTFLFAHLTYQRCVLSRWKGNHDETSSDAAVDRALLAVSTTFSSTQSSSTLVHAEGGVEGLAVEMTRTRERPSPPPPATIKTASSLESLP